MLHGQRAPCMAAASSMQQGTARVASAEGCDGDGGERACDGNGVGGERAWAAMAAVSVMAMMVVTAE